MTISAMGYYFWRCTGSPMRTPYIVSAQNYEVAPFFPWQRLRPVPQYRNTILKEFYTGWNVDQYERIRKAPYAVFITRAIQALLFYCGPLLVLPWLLTLGILPSGLPLAALGYKTSLLIKICFVSVIGMALPIYFEPHYAAPLCCAFYVLEIQALRRIRIWRWHRDRKGAAIVRQWAAACVVLFVLRIAAGAFHIGVSEIAPSWSGPRIENLPRAKIANSLSKDPGSHLILVHYAPNHVPQAEWVYNGADLDSSKIVWARDLGPSENRELTRYFSARTAWLSNADVSLPHLLPYTEESRSGESQAALKNTAEGKGK